ncbi:Uncharacterized protein DBV15_06178 [Temnothorax longispinosus]|uniref:Uncharacterized protein n=1 Tax=Temnothorax longispinosus TaxID=300112 RepID=A0A4S2JQ33_9HYME|nr:Uncharacterized protein DBV15_06178 [Temnothorax longispinosus]
MHHEISICAGALLGGSTMSDVECNRVRYESNKNRRNFRGDVLPKLLSARDSALAQHARVSLVSELTFATDATPPVGTSREGWSP